MKSESLHNMGGGKLVISLDFELLWGLTDPQLRKNYLSNIEKVADVLPKIIDLFDEYEVRATIATVGFLFAADIEELMEYLPKHRPVYRDKGLSSYDLGAEVFNGNDGVHKLHFAKEVFTKIKDNPNHELGSHTFSHYYCLEKGQTLDDFKEDLGSAIRIAQAKDVSLKSMVFPRNQINAQYLKACADMGILTYRGTEDIWFQRPQAEETVQKHIRVLRYLDSYFNLSGHHTYAVDDIPKVVPYNIASSRFLRSYNPSLKFLESRKLSRIRDSMTFAAKNNRIFHLWWHPHNFGRHDEKNLLMLENILKHYEKLSAEYNFHSITMTDLGENIQRMEACREKS